MLPSIEHLRSFAMWTAFPSADYYDHSVAMGLATRRRSRVSPRRTYEHDVGPLFVPLNDLIGRRPTGGGFEQRKTDCPILSVPS